MPATSLNHTHTYTLRQLPLRDEVVFKSVIRVLQGKTRHTWLHSDDQDAAELVLLGDQLPAGAVSAGMEKISGRAVIHVSAHGGSDFHGLAWPLRVADVIAQLDKAGDLIDGRVAVSPASPISRPAPLAAMQQAVHERQLQPAPVQAQPAHVPADQRVSLSRWPEANLLQRDMRYIKLATVLTGKPVSIMELADRTHYPLQLCQSFVDALNAGALVRVMSGDLREMPLGQMAGHNQAAMNGGYASAHKSHSEHHGLIARIRSRLEMIVRPTATR